MRARDHGVLDYNSARVAYGLPAVTDWAQINPWLDNVNPDVSSQSPYLYMYTTTNTTTKRTYNRDQRYKAEMGFFGGDSSFSPYQLGGPGESCELSHWGMGLMRRSTNSRIRRGAPALQPRECI